MRCILSVSAGSIPVHGINHWALTELSLLRQALSAPASDASYVDKTAGFPFEHEACEPPLTEAPVSRLMRFGRSSGSPTGVWPWTTTLPW